MNLKSVLRSRILHIAAAAAAALAVGFFTGRSFNVSPGAPEPSQNLIQPVTYKLSGNEMQTAADLQEAWRGVAQRVLPAVVEIDVGTAGRTEGLGSGVIVQRDGKTVYVLTNNHVVGEAETISVKLHDGKNFTATLTGKDPKRDLALVEFQTDAAVTVAELGNSDALQVGDWVMAVGNPLGFNSTVTEGIVSAIGRQGLSNSGNVSFTDYIQTDAAINQGNSGGALVDIYGRLVGINSWIASYSGGNVGLGFAIPVNNAKSVIDDFISSGKASYGWLGISMGTESSEDGGTVQGAYVFSVYRDSPAWAAGILPGDSIVAINNEPIEDSNRLLLVVGNFSPGQKADFTILRENRRIHADVVITKRADDENLQAQAAGLWPGMTLVQITKEIRTKLSLPKDTGNIIVSSVMDGSPAADAGLKPGDVINSIDNRKPSTLPEFYTALNKGSRGKVLLEGTRQGGLFRAEIVK